MRKPTTEELLTSLRESAACPLGEASAMQPGLYRSEEILGLEHELIFDREWLCVGRAADIAQPGDYVTFAIGDQPIVTMRGKDGVIRSFANICLHRMMQLLAGKGNRRRIVCPYHAWTYDIDGSLIAAPHMEKSEGFKARSERLPAIRTEIWQGFVYVTMNNEAPSVAEQLAELEPIVSRYRMEHYVPVATEDYVWNTNWKLLTENFMESYHLPVAHRQTVGAWFPVDTNGFDDKVFEHFTYQTFTKNEDAKYGLAHKDNAALEGRWRYTSVMPTVYPSHMYVLAPDHLWYLSLRPKGLGHVDVRFGVAIAPEVMATLTDRETFVRDTIAFFDKVNAEDKGVVEGIYQGAKAPLSKPGRLSWMEREIHDFMGYLAKSLAPEKGEAAEPRMRVAARK
jgi:phenylpropionate dioxygenase-like ring-hydroxylating dioxygenase large terminal subunit